MRALARAAILAGLVALSAIGGGYLHSLVVVHHEDYVVRVVRNHGGECQIRWSVGSLDKNNQAKGFLDGEGGLGCGQQSRVHDNLYIACDCIGEFPDAGH